MKRKLLAVAAALTVLSAQAVSVSADYYYDAYGYDTGAGYTYDNGAGYGTYDYGTGYYGDTTTQGYDDGTGYANGVYPITSLDSSSAADPDVNKPATIILSPSKIKDKKFTADLKIDSGSKVTAADFTINYDSNVLKLNSSTVNPKAPGTCAAAETQPGVMQFQYSNAEGSEWKESYLTLNFEITDVTERSTVLYIAVNSLSDENRHELTYRADGTIIQIEGAVPVDASADESMYTEVRIAKTDQVIAYESLGLKDVKSVKIEDTSVAQTAEGGITTLSAGLTNMTVEFNGGYTGYFRLVISDPAAAASEQPAAQTNVSAADPNAAQPAQTTISDTGIQKTETKHSNKKLMYIIIYALVLVAVIAILVEYFTIVGNPYKKTAEILKNAPSGRPAKRRQRFDDDVYPEEENDGGEYEDAGGYEESGEEYEDGEYYVQDTQQDTEVGEEYYDESQQAETAAEDSSEYYEDEASEEYDYEDDDNKSGGDE